MDVQANLGATRAGTRARLYLGGVSTAVTADVCHRSEARLAVRHALPFLRLDSEVMDDEGRFARIESVSVSVEGATPMLHIELAYPPSRARRDATLPYGLPAPTRAPAVAVVGRSAREDDTIVFPTRVADDEPATPPPGFVERLLAYVRQLVARLLRPRPSLPATSG